jgi:hypothetical protein
LFQRFFLGVVVDEELLGFGLQMVHFVTGQFIFLLIFETRVDRSWLQDGRDGGSGVFGGSLLLRFIKYNAHLS